MKKLLPHLLLALLVVGCEETVTEPEPEDCAGVVGGSAVVDCLGECGGSAIEDCAGVCDGDAVEDECGVCGGDGSTCICQSCQYDYTDYGSECCDSAWMNNSINCVTLEIDYSWNCYGCTCPGDNCSGSEIVYGYVEECSWQTSWVQLGSNSYCSANSCFPYQSCVGNPQCEAPGMGCSFVSTCIVAEQQTEYVCNTEYTCYCP